MTTSNTTACSDEAAVAALLAMATHGVPPDIQELLIHGNPDMHVRPGALAAAIGAAMNAILDHRIANG